MGRGRQSGVNALSVAATPAWSDGHSPDAVRSPMGKRVSHPDDGLDVGGRSRLDHAADPAHQSTPHARASWSACASAL